MQAVPYILALIAAGASVASGISIRTDETRLGIDFVELPEGEVLDVEAMLTAADLPPITRGEVFWVEKEADEAVRFFERKADAESFLLRSEKKQSSYPPGFKSWMPVHSGHHFQNPKAPRWLKCTYAVVWEV